jgi:hypothetical protein
MQVHAYTNNVCDKIRLMLKNIRINYKYVICDKQHNVNYFSSRTCFFFFKKKKELGF